MTTDHETFLAIVMLAMLLDTIMGDPPFLPHPVRIIGAAIGVFENIAGKIGRGKHFERFAGVVLTFAIVGMTFFLSWAVQYMILQRSSGPARLLGIAFLVYLAASTLALKELIKAGSGVIGAVRADDMALARQRLRMIVGRDVDSLDRDGILRATIETLSENLSDGVIAPLLYLTVGGIPCALAYKAVNTLDSTVGYRNERYLHLGWASARLDDIVNYVPARISALLIAFAAAIVLRSPEKALAALTTMRSDGCNHSSPNSGYPEAAVAGALGVRLGGPSTYGGIMIHKPHIGTSGRTDYLTASMETVGIIRIASFTGFFCAVIAISLGVVL